MTLLHFGAFQAFLGGVLPRFVRRLRLKDYVDSFRDFGIMQLLVFPCLSGIFLLARHRVVAPPLNNFLAVLNGLHVGVRGVLSLYLGHRMARLRLSRSNYARTNPWLSTGRIFSQ